MDPKETGEFEKLERRLKDLKERTGEGNSGKAPEINRDAGMAGLAWRISIELVAGIVVGLGIGYILDRWLGTKPAFMITFIFLGFAAGIYNVIRVSQSVQRNLERKDK